jgi:hypothetical protein
MGGNLDSFYLFFLKTKKNIQNWMETIKSWMEKNTVGYFFYVWGIKKIFPLVKVDESFFQ